MLWSKLNNYYVVVKLNRLSILYMGISISRERKYKYSPKLWKCFAAKDWNKRLIRQEPSILIQFAFEYLFFLHFRRLSVDNSDPGNDRQVPDSCVFRSHLRLRRRVDAHRGSQRSDGNLIIRCWDRTPHISPHQCPGNTLNPTSLYYFKIFEKQSHFSKFIMHVIFFYSSVIPQLQCAVNKVIWDKSN